MGSPVDLYDADVDSDDSLEGCIPEKNQRELVGPSVECQPNLNTMPEQQPIGQQEIYQVSDNEPSTSTGITVESSELDGENSERPPLRRSNRIRKGRKILTYGKLGVPKIQRYSILNLEYRPGDKSRKRDRARVRDSGTNSPTILPVIQKDTPMISQ